MASKPRDFHLHDPVTGQTLAVEVVAVGTFLNLHPAGYGQPVSLDFYEGKLRVIVDPPDPDEEDPTVIELEPEPEEAADAAGSD